MTDPKEQGMPTTRNVQIDFLRILAALGVVCIHVCASNLSLSALSPIQRKMVLSIDMIMGNNWSVPCFFMISGAFMLSSKSDVPLGAFYRKRLPRILIPLLFWNLVYFAISWKLSGCNVSVSEFIRRMFSNGTFYHLWYLYALASLYVFAPFLRKLVASCTRSELSLLVCMGFLFTFVRIESNIPILFCGLSDNYTNGIGYFLAGYLFLKYPLRVNKILLFGVLLCGNVLCLWIDLNSNGWNLGRIFVSSAMFILCVQNISIPEKMSPWVRYHASLTFGIYLVHPIWLIITQRVLSNKFSVMNGWEFIWRIPIEIFVVFTCSAITAAVMLRIPFLRRTI